MKIHTTFCLILLMSGCSKDLLEAEISAPEDLIEKAVEFSSLQLRGELAYLPNTEKPYNGWIKQNYEVSEQVKFLMNFKDGMLSELRVWYPNGSPGLFIGFSTNLNALPALMQDIEDVTDLNENHRKSSIHPNDESFVELENVGVRFDNRIASWYVNGQKAFNISLKEGKREGLHQEWYENGQKAFEASFKADKLVDAISWLRNGEKCPQTSLKNGNGLFVQHIDEFLRETHYVDGRKHGTEIKYRDDRSKSIETPYVDGKKHGMEIEYREDGSKSIEIPYVNGLLHGTQIEYRVDGSKVGEIPYVNGKCHGTVIVYGVDGSTTRSAPYVDGKKHGTVIEYREDGSKRSETTYVEGIEQ
jgi:antitoxin component YwqK of YwqJK toxin-antitoxin module